MIPLYSEIEFNSAKSETKLPLQCKQCSNAFYRTKNYIKSCTNPNNCHTGEYCSTKCQNAYAYPPVFVDCKQCNKSFKKLPSQIKKYPNHFCSSSCAATYNNQHKTTGNRRSKLEIYLEDELPKLYPDLEFLFNKKDAINSELDIYIPSLKLAFELNGIFHYEPIYGKDKLSQIQNNDQRKIQACIERNIEFCIIDTSTLKYFKPVNAKKYLDIITSIIDKCIL